MIGFTPQATAARRAIYRQDGEKIGYLRASDGYQILEDANGRIVARILRFKSATTQLPSACGGSFLPRGWWSNGW
jgi:archaeosine-15-forming tRNA-guanine transglycosylase